MQEVEHGSKLPHRPQVPPRQLRRRRGRFRQLRDDLTAFRRRQVLLPFDRRRVGTEAGSGADGARAGGAAAPPDGRWIGFRFRRR